MGREEQTVEDIRSYSLRQELTSHIASGENGAVEQALFPALEDIELDAWLACIWRKVRHQFKK